MLTAQEARTLASSTTATVPGKSYRLGVQQPQADANLSEKAETRHKTRLQHQKVTPHGR